MVTLYPPSTDLFVYGTLMQAPIQRQLLGRSLLGWPALLFGFRRVVRPGSYPFICQAADGRVHGMLLRGVSAQEVATLDEYEDEGQLYLRQRVTVRVGALDQAAFAYVGLSQALRNVRRTHFDHNRERLSTTPH